MTVRPPPALATLGMILVAAASAPAHGGLEGAFVAVGDDVVARFFHAAGRLDGVPTVMVTGGMRLQLLPPSLVSLATVSFFDPDADAFASSFAPWNGGPSTTPALGVARSGHTQTALPGGRVLVCGGHVGASGSSPGAPTASVEIFDPWTGAFAAGPAMSAPRAAHTATALADGRVVVAGGATWQVFDPATNAWSVAHALHRTRTGHAAARLDGAGGGTAAVLLIGGAGTGSATLERLDPDAGTSTLLDAMLPTGVDDLAAATLDDGTVVIVGGQRTDSGDTIATTLVYDPSKDALAPRPDMPGVPDGVSDHRLVVLDRRVLAVGGESQVAGADTELAVASVFDRRCGWTGTGAMLDPHDDAAAVALLDGRVLVIGGGAPFLGQEAPISACEAFVPAALRTADLDCDGVVGFGDLVILLASWGECAPGPCDADLDGDGTIGFGDLLVVLNAWG